ncbi:MAG: hypothetical protein ACI8PZ_002558 [Myxococcota bacterium]|jgi:hypothetical protein
MPTVPLAALPPVQRTLVEVLAVAGAEITHTMLLSALRTVGRMPDGKAWSSPPG